MKKPFPGILRSLLAICLLAVGMYWFVYSFPEWYQEGFPVFTSGDKGKDVFSGVFFSAIFVFYGVWEMYRLVASNKPKN